MPEPGSLPIWIGSEVEPPGQEGRFTLMNLSPPAVASMTSRCSSASSVGRWVHLLNSLALGRPVGPPAGLTLRAAPVLAASPDARRCAVAARDPYSTAGEVRLLDANRPALALWSLDRSLADRLDADLQRVATLGMAPHS